MMNNITSLKGFKIIHLNIRSLWKNQHEFFINFNGFDIIALSETWLHHNIPDCMVNESGYSIIRQDRSNDNNKEIKAKGGGLLFYVKTTYSKYISKLDNPNPIGKDLEHLWLEINIPFRRKILLGLCYRPPSGNVTIANSLISAQLKSFELNSSHDVLLIGDFNVNYLDRNTIGFKGLKDIERRFLLHQIIDTPTRIHNQSKSLIDLIFTNIDHIMFKGTIEVSISDHLPIFIVIKKCKKFKNTTNFTGRSYKNYNVEQYQTSLKEDPQWTSYWLSHDVNVKWKIFHEIVMRCADLYCPLVQMRLNTDSEGWLTKEVIEAIFEKNRKYKIARRSRSAEDWTSFKIQRKYARKLLLNTKEEFLKNQLEIHRANPRNFWRKLNGIIGNSKNSQTFTCIQNDNGVKLEKSDAAEYMNDYFTNIGESLNTNNDSIWCPHSFFQKPPSNGFLLNVIDENIVKKYIKHLDISKPSGLLNLNNKLLCDAFKVLTFELTALFNDSLVYQVFPSDWKMGMITPIPKPGNLKLKTNWRPITILSTPGKLLEKIVHFQTSTYLTLNEILTNDQHGFRQNYSTSSAILEFLTDIYDAKLTNMVTGCVYIDYQKAFDTINHNILYSKLELYGFSNSCVNWFKSYLGHRSQKTKCDGEYLSTSRPVTIGVPQGSTLGPLLFILYVNDLCHVKHIFNVSLKMYADDTVVYTSGNSVDEVKSTLQLCMDYVYNWCFSNRLYMNMKKTKVMWFQNTDKSTFPDVKYTINVDGNVLSRVYSYQYLGVELDTLLSYDKHLESVVNKTMQKLFVFRKIRRFISEKTAITVYKQMILPLLEYCNILFNSGKKTKLEKVDKIQSKCVRIIENCYDVTKRANESDLCKLYNIESLQSRRDVQLACTMFRLSKFERYIDPTKSRDIFAAITR